MQKRLFLLQCKRETNGHFSSGALWLSSTNLLLDFAGKSVLSVVDEMCYDEYVDFSMKNAV